VRPDAAYARDDLQHRSFDASGCTIGSTRAGGVGQSPRTGNKAAWTAAVGPRISKDRRRTATTMFRVLVHLGRNEVEAGATSVAGRRERVGRQYPLDVIGTRSRLPRQARDTLFMPFNRSAPPAARGVRPGHRPHGDPGPWRPRSSWQENTPDGVATFRIELEGRDSERARRQIVDAHSLRASAAVRGLIWDHEQHLGP